MLVWLWLYWSSSIGLAPLVQLHQSSCTCPVALALVRLCLRQSGCSDSSTIGLLNWVFSCPFQVLDWALLEIGTPKTVFWICLFRFPPTAPRPFWSKCLNCRWEQDILSSEVLPLIYFFPTGRKLLYLLNLCVGLLCLSDGCRDDTADRRKIYCSSFACLWIIFSCHAKGND